MEKKVRQMFWAAFGHRIQTDLIYMERDLNAPHRRDTARIYHEVLEGHLPWILDEDLIFRHDKCVYTHCKIIPAFLEEAYLSTQ